MDKSGKIYVKAMNKYNDGYIDKALSLCEKSISLNITNSAALNLKGILYYLKGDLETAKKTWNVNYKRNNDQVSKKYLKDSINDMPKLNLYVNALEHIKRLNISSALEVLEQCEDSHFNFINVNNHMALCYIKQGEYDKALHYINEVLRVDRKNIMALSNKKILIEYGAIKREINYKNIFISFSGIFLILIIVLFGKTFINKVKDLPLAGMEKIQHKISAIKQNKQVPVVEAPKINDVKKNSQQEKDTEIKNLEQPKEVKDEKKQQQTLEFSAAQLKVSMVNNNMEELAHYVNLWKDAELPMNDKLLLIKAEEQLKNQGVAYFYEKGVNYMSEKKITDAQKYFLYALSYSKGNYLQEHIVYMLALSYKSVSDFENATKYYEQYVEQFPSGNYLEEVLYNLIIINKDINISKAKIYAKKLVKEFPQSQYNNTVVKDIIK